MTCWDAFGLATVAPSAILEWKFGASAICEPDVAWLKAFSVEHPGFIGYALTANTPSINFRLSCTRVTAGTAKSQWVHIP